MKGRAPARRRGSYGVNAPESLIVYISALAAALMTAAVFQSAECCLTAAGMIAGGACSLHTTRRGQFAVWSDLLDALALGGGERILDLGCGRGAVLLLAAQRLTAGRAVGLDIWRKRDQSGNAAEATQRNAVAEGVADRVELVTANMTALPFCDRSFDLILSSMAVHNLRGRAGRDRAIEEAVRVLRPGGRLVIADIAGTARYCARLEALGMTDVTRFGLGWRMWWTGPWLPTRLVHATKPARRL